MYVHSTTSKNTGVHTAHRRGNKVVLKMRCVFVGVWQQRRLLAAMAAFVEWAMGKLVCLSPDAYLAQYCTQSFRIHSKVETVHSVCAF